MASDIDAGILSIAARNLSLLTPQGLKKRAQEITGLLDQYGKPSHALAAESVQRFSRQLNTCSQTHPITTQLFKADATIRAEVTSGIMGRQIDIVMADVPYGMLSKWQSPAHETTTINTGFLELMLGALLPVLSTDSMVAIMSNKAQKCNHPQYQRLGRFQVGKRLVTLLQPGQG
jgi:predicted Abi (CAAX) family protease